MSNNNINESALSDAIYRRLANLLLAFQIEQPTTPNAVKIFIDFWTNNKEH